MKLLFLASLVWLANPLAPSASDELKRERLPADVDFVIHLDMEALRSTELWKHVSEQSEDFDLDIDELDDIRREFGIDPLTDVRALTLYKVESEEEPTVVLFSSNSRVDEALEKLQLEDGYRRLVSSGIELHTWSDDSDDDEDRMFAYVHAIGAERVVVLAANERSAVRAARVLRGEDPSHASAGTLLTLAPARGSFMYVAAAEIPSFDDDEDSPASQIFGLAQGIQFDVGEAGGYLRAHMGLITNSAEDALNISNVINGLISMARLWGSELGEAVEFLTGVRLSSRGTEVTVDWEFAVERMIEIFESVSDEYDLGERAEAKEHRHKERERDARDKAPQDKREDASGQRIRIKGKSKLK